MVAHCHFMIDNYIVSNNLMSNMLVLQYFVRMSNIVLTRDS